MLVNLVTYYFIVFFFIKAFYNVCLKFKVKSRTILLFLTNEKDRDYKVRNIKLE